MNYKIETETETTVKFASIVCNDCDVEIENVTQNKLGKTAGQVAQSFVCDYCRNEKKQRRRR